MLSQDPPSKRKGESLKQSGRILIVDDDASLREVLSELLTGSGYVVATCPDGRTALEALQRDTYDTVMSDIRMPDMDGLQLLRAVRERNHDLPVVLLTGGPSLETAIEAVEQGALQYLVKPVSEDQLLEVAARAVKLGALARLKREILGARGVDGLLRDRAALEAAFSRALATLWMAYQPIARASDGSLHGHEALLRTAEPTFPAPPGLLSAAEQLGRLHDLGRAIRKSVAGSLASGVLPKDVFVNLHPMDLLDEALVDRGAPLSRFASRVVLEVTERASLGAVSDVAARVGALRDLGFRIALDDLGTGYAGLNSFVALTPDIVKLDTSLIRGLGQDVVKQKLVASMAQLCRDLDIRVVAEGVETQGEWDAARAAGCELVQGYLMGRPAALAGPPPSSPG